ncbi:MAG: hypothetical protein LBE91_17160, partial [Tannerella sp.]|nr:hypothetical protein [Tannerella sp.]
MRRFLLTIIFTCLIFQFFGKIENTVFRERVYVQTDKQVYLAGEKIQMKLMTLDTERVPLVFSKVAYVELVRDSIARVQIKVALENGVGEGRMSLPVNLPSGYYRLIAYTRYMRNEGTEVFFEKNIGIINTFQSDYYPETAETAVENISSSLSRRDNLAGAVSVQPDKAVYSTRERGELLITGLPENIHTLSVCIAGKEIIETDVSAHFQNIRPADPASFTGEFLPEYEGHIVTGTMINNQTGETVTDNALLIPALSFPGEGIRFYTGEKNEKDEILFFTSGNYGTGQIATVVYDPEENWRIDIQSPFISKFAPKPMPALHIDSVCYGQLLERSVALQASHYFYNDSLENRRISPSAFKLKPTYVYPLDDYTRFTTMREIFIEFILTARFRRNDGVRELQVFLKNGNESYYGTNPLILLDGAPIANHELVYNYDPL